jgi:hypothetical protein
MPKPRRHTLKTVRRRSIAWAAIPSFLLAFGVVAFGVYSLGKSQVESDISAEEPRFTATVYVSDPTFGSPVPIVWSDDTAKKAEDEARVIAQCYVNDQLTAWQERADAALQEAKSGTQQAKERHEANMVKLDVLRRAMATPAVKEKSETVAPTMVRNPLWTDLDRKLTMFEARKTQLLVNRTPQHPFVVEVSDRIAEVQRQLAKVPREIAANDSARPDRSNSDKASSREEAELGALVAATNASRRVWEDAQETEKKVAAAQQQTPKYSVLRTELTEAVPVLDTSFRLVRMSFAAGLMMAMGVGALVWGIRLAPVVGTSLDVQLAALAPVLAVAPAASPIPHPEKLARQQYSNRRFLMALGILLMLACPIATFLAIRSI